MRVRGNLCRAMDEILFRAKAINRDCKYGYSPNRRSGYKNGDWVYGLITKPYNEKYDFPAEMRNTNGISGIEVDYKTRGESIYELCNRRCLYLIRRFGYAQ